MGDVGQDGGQACFVAELPADDNCFVMMRRGCLEISHFAFQFAQGVDRSGKTPAIACFAHAALGVRQLIEGCGEVALLGGDASEHEAGVAGTECDPLPSPDLERGAGMAGGRGQVALQSGEVG